MFDVDVSARRGVKINLLPAHEHQSIKGKIELFWAAAAHTEVKQDPAAVPKSKGIASPAVGRECNWQPHFSVKITVAAVQLFPAQHPLVKCW